MKYLTRTTYLNKIINLQNTPDIKVITGMRRSGKLVLLKEFIRYLQENENETNIIFINLQEIEFESLLEYHNLHSYIMDHYKEGVHNVVLIDEVQLC